ncbi:unnamed protein product [Prunus armeniaca]
MGELRKIANPAPIEAFETRVTRTSLADPTSFKNTSLRFLPNPTLATPQIISASLPNGKEH